MIGVTLTGHTTMAGLFSKQTLAAALCLCVIFLSGCSLSSRSLKDDGTPRLIDLAGKEHTLGEYFAGHTLMILWASWCPECVVELSSLNLVKKNLAARDIRVITVAINDDLGSVRECPPVRHAQYPVLIDIKNQVRLKYPLNSLPTVYLLNQEGEPVSLIDPEDGLPKSEVTGFREWQSKAGTRAILDSLSTQKP